MRALPNIIFHPSNLEEVKALKALGKAFKMNFEISKSDKSYNPEFVAKIEKSRQQIKEGNYKVIKTEDLWK